METKNHDSVIPATNPNGSDLNARSAARRAKGRKPDVTQVSSVYRLSGAAECLPPHTAVRNNKRQMSAYHGTVRLYPWFNWHET